jgi:hypothetical protein
VLHDSSAALESSAPSVSLERDSSPLIANPSANIATTSKTGEGFNEANIAFHVRAFIAQEALDEDHTAEFWGTAAVFRDVALAR